MRINPKQRQTSSESGQTLIMFTLFVIVLVLFVGLGIDLGFAYVSRARLSKSVDAACLMGIRNLSQGQGPALQVAQSAFKANYGTVGRDVGTVSPNASFTTDANNNLILHVDATTTINTFFIRILPAWQTLKVASVAEAIRPRLILGLVLDRSGSMNGNGGATNLPPAVGTFIDKFIENHDRASMSSFAYHGRMDEPMNTVFKQPIKNAANALIFDGWTGSEPGLTNGWMQVRNTPVVAGEKIVKAVVFMTDGLANTWQYTFDCGGVMLPQNIAPGPDLYDPNTGASVTCTIPATIPWIYGGGNVNPSIDCEVLEEGQRRAIHIARQIRAEGIFVYAIGLGDPNGPTECTFPPLNLPFLRTVANEGGVDGAGVQGVVAVATTAGDLDRAFEEIANKILARLTK